LYQFAPDIWQEKYQLAIKKYKNDSWNFQFADKHGQKGALKLF